MESHWNGIPCGRISTPKPCHDLVLIARKKGRCGRAGIGLGFDSPVGLLEDWSDDLRLVSSDDMKLIEEGSNGEEVRMFAVFLPVALE